MSRHSKEKINILLVRPDRIGDVILSTPCLKAIKQAFPNSRLSVLVRKEIAPLLRKCPEVDDVIPYHPSKRHHGFSGVLNLIQQIKKRKIDKAFVLQNTWEVSLAVYLAGVADRIGPYSHFHSYLFFNKGIRQRRSQVKMHEADYNLELLQKGGVSLSSSLERQYSTSICVSERASQMADSVLSELNWNKFIVIHPGMRGSAQNWPLENYIELIKKCQQRKKNIFLSFGPEEQTLMEEVKKRVGLSDSLYYYGGKRAKSLSVLAGFYQRATVVVAPSTGPLHLAVALGIPVVSFYPKISVQSVKRWGPYVLDSHQAFVFEGIEDTSVVDVLNKVCEYDSDG